MTRSVVRPVRLPRLLRRLAPAAAALLVAGCDAGVKTMDASKIGVRFRTLPTFVGGGLSEDLLLPGATAFVMPWEQILEITAQEQQVSWGPGRLYPEYVHTRAADGNEVALAFTVRYRVSAVPADLVNLVQYVAVDDDAIRRLVTTVGRAYIRHYMNELRTADFIDPARRTAAVDKVREEMRRRLRTYFIDVVQVNLEEYRFERLLEGEKKDDTYQDRLDEVQKLAQETFREESRIATVQARKQEELNKVQASVNRMVEEAQGEKLQATIRGDNYLLARANEAKALLSRGSAEAEGTEAQIKALDGPGGVALLKLDVSEALVRGGPRFAVVDEGEGNGALSVRRTDTNGLLDAIGVTEALRSDPKAPAAALRSEVATPASEPPPSGDSPAGDSSAGQSTAGQSPAGQSPAGHGSPPTDGRRPE